MFQGYFVSAELDDAGLSVSEFRLACMILRCSAEGLDYQKHAILSSDISPREFTDALVSLADRQIIEWRMKGDRVIWEISDPSKWLPKEKEDA